MMGIGSQSNNSVLTDTPAGAGAVLPHGASIGSVVDTAECPSWISTGQDTTEVASRKSQARTAVLALVLFSPASSVIPYSVPYNVGHTDHLVIGSQPCDQIGVASSVSFKSGDWSSRSGTWLVRDKLSSAALALIFCSVEQ